MGPERVERCQEVGLLAVELGPVAGLGQVERPLRVTVGEGPGFPRVVELLPGVEPNGLEQPVAPRVGDVAPGHERLLHEPDEDVDDLGALEPVAGADGLDRSELEPAGEHRQAAEKQPLVGLEQVVAPLERRLEGLLAGRRGVAPGAQHAEAVVQSLGDDGGTECAEPAGRQLERERQAVQPDADAGDVGGVLPVQRKLRCGCRRPVDEQPDGLEAEEVVRLELLAQVGDGERGHPEHDLAGDAQGLAARRDDGQARRRPEERVDERRARSQHVLAVVHDEQEGARGEEVDEGADDLLARERAYVEGGRGCGRHETRVGHRRELDDDRARGIRLLHLARQLEGEPGLPRATGAGEGQQARSVEQRAQLGQLVPAPDERARVRRQAPETVVRRKRGQLRGQRVVQRRQLGPARSAQSS